MSLFEKYRQLYPDLIQCLGNARKHGRFAHAFLVYAPDPAARKEFAVVLAQFAGCPHAAETGFPDTDCPYCRRIANDTFPELHKLFPVGKMYQIKVGDRVNPEPNTLRHFISAFHLTSSSVFSRKIGVIYECDRMNDEAQNALLKTLEEPPPETTLILVTANPAVLLPTTRSRCQLIPLPENICRYDFPHAEDVFRALGKLCFSNGGIVAAEEGVEVLLEVVGLLSAAAENKVNADFASQLAAAKAADDPAYLKRLEQRIADMAVGEYMRQRSVFVSAVATFCHQVFLLSRRVPLEQLPNPELFVMPPPPEIPESEGDRILQEAEELQRTLRFNVSEELAWRTFAVNLAVR